MEHGFADDFSSGVSLWSPMCGGATVWDMPEPTRTTEFRSYSAAEVAAYLGVSRQTVHRWVVVGKLSAFDIGGPGRPRIRITSGALDAFIAARPMLRGSLTGSWVGVR